jgi:hypothetical protein
MKKYLFSYIDDHEKIEILCSFDEQMCFFYKKQDLFKKEKNE